MIRVSLPSMLNQYCVLLVVIKNLQEAQLYGLQSLWSGILCLAHCCCRPTCLTAVTASAKAFLPCLTAVHNQKCLTTEQLALAGEGKEKAPQEPRAKELPYVIDCPSSYEVSAYPSLEVGNL